MICYVLSFLTNAFPSILTVISNANLTPGVSVLADVLDSGDTGLFL